MDVARWSNSRSILNKVPNYNFYVGRQTNGKTLGRAYNQQALIDRMASQVVRPDIDFSLSFKENLAYLKRQVEKRYVLKIA